MHLDKPLNLGILINTAKTTSPKIASFYESLQMWNEAEMLSFDTSLNQYYKKSYYLKDSFLSDINCVLEDGDLVLGDYDDFNKLQVLISSLPKGETNVVLTYSKKMVTHIENILQNIKREDIRVMTMQSIKGLEAQNVIIHQY